MENIFRILKGTPWWAWLALVYLLYRGLRATQNRIVPVQNLFIIPVLLISLKYTLFFSGNWPAIGLYFGCLALGIALGCIIAGLDRVVILKNQGAIQLPGTYQTLILLMLFFCIKYFFGYLRATQPAFVIEYGWIEVVASAVLSGYFLGRALRYLQRYLSAA